MSVLLHRGLTTLTEPHSFVELQHSVNGMAASCLRPQYFRYRVRAKSSYKETAPHIEASTRMILISMIVEK